MIKPNDNDELFEDYIFEQLSEKERNDFEERLKSDQTFRQSFLKKKEVVNGVEVFGRDELKKELQSMHQELYPSETQKPRVRNMRPWMAAAAAIAVLVITFIWINKGSESSELYASYYEPFELKVTTRSTLDGDQLNKAAQDYALGEFSEAIPGFEKLLADNPENNMIRLSLGICYLEKGGYTQAESKFKKVIEDEDPLFEDQGRWYLALLYLKENKSDLAKSLLVKLTNDEDADHHNEALELLEKLN